MTRIVKKLRCNAGESLAETLIAVLIIAVALTMLASMISSTSTLIKKGEETLNEYYTESEKLETFDGSTEGQTVSFTASSENTYVPNLNISPVSVEYAENNIFTGHPVIAYRIKPTA